MPSAESQHFPTSLSAGSILFVAHLTPLFLPNRLTEDVQGKGEDCSSCFQNLLDSDRVSLPAFPVP